MKKHVLKHSFYLLAIAGIFLQSGPAKGQPTVNPSAPASWSIVASYTIPGKASGLAWDGNYIYSGIYGANGNQIFKFNPSTGTNTLQCTGPFEDAYGLTFKSPNLVTISQPSNSSLSSSALEFTLSGTQVSSIPLPDHYMSGIAWDNGTYWVATYYPDNGIIYNISNTGAVLSQFTPPNNQPWDICMQGSDLWIADYYGNMLYKVSNTGTLLESHATQTMNPSGIVFDGTYLWYCDGQYGASSSTLYKVDLTGSGTPAINVPVTAHDYGTVTIGNTSTWNCQVQNTGNANIVINSVGIPAGQPITTTYATPATITPGNSANIPLKYSPTMQGSMNTTVSIHSNDPIHPSIPVNLTGDAVYAGPHLIITASTHNWGERRSGAYSRWYLPVSNNGNQALTITGLDFSDPHFILDEADTLPISVGTLDTTFIGIWFHPTEGAVFTGTLEVSSNDPTQNPFTIDLSGTGVVTDYPIGTPLWNYTINASILDNSPKAIRAISDITGDGVDDVIIASEDYYIRCFNGNSSGEADVIWSKLIYSGPVYQQNGLATIDDINNDGYRDVVVGTTGGSCSVIALSGKTGAQLWKYDTHEYGGGGWVYQVDVRYDYNNDGFPDVLACAGDDGNGTGPKRVFCINGKTGVPVWRCALGGPGFSVIGVEDFTNDGKPDIIGGASDAGETTGKVFGIDGSTGIIKWTSITAGSSVWGLMQIDDVTGDGINDVASGDFSGNIYFHNAINGTQFKHTSIGNVLVIRFENIGDVNKDGHPDILVAHSGTTGKIINGYDISTIWSKPLADKAWTVANMGDITLDGTNDAAIGTLYSNNRAYFMDGTNGEILESVAAGDAVDALGAIPDIVGDDTKELVVGERDGVVRCLSGGFDPSVEIKTTGNQQQDYARVYPNPCTDILNVAVELKKTSPVKLTLTDITGRILFSFEKMDVSQGRQVFQIDKSRFGRKLIKGGVYLVNLKTNQSQYHFKVVFD
jgi:hypothetical protein